ncbi:XK-related protein 6, partial [Stegodyphus mimosarum]
MILTMEAGEDSFRNKCETSVKAEGNDEPLITQNQETNERPRISQFDILDILIFVYAICCFLFDLSFDILLAVLHYYGGNMWYFGLTVCFIAVPSFTTTAFSLQWYISDSLKKDAAPVSTKQWIVRGVFLTLQLGPILRYLDALYYGLKSVGKRRQEQKYLTDMINEAADAGILRLFECFLEDIPQLLLQLYIFARSEIETPEFYDTTELLQLFTMFVSVIAMASSLAAFERANRKSLKHKKNMSICSTIVVALWRFFEITARVLALGLFASLFLTYFFIAIALHYGIMFTWIRFMKTDFCHNKCGEFLYNLVLAIVYMFSFFSAKDGTSRHRVTFFYVLMFLENTSLMSIWFVYCPVHARYRYPAMLIHFISFLLGLAFMLLYYLLLHPT